jgi:hypothetical protein
MKQEFTLAITPNYGKTILKIVVLFLVMIVPLGLLGILAANEIIDPKNINFGLILPLYLFGVAIGTFFVIRKTHFKDTVVLTDHSLEIPKLTTIAFDEIAAHKVFTAANIPSYIITLKNGKKIAFGSTDNYSDEASKEFADFIEIFKEKFDKNS